MREKDSISCVLLALIKLNPQYKYQLLFVISNTIYHSLDFLYDVTTKNLQGNNQNHENIEITDIIIWYLGINLLSLLVNFLLIKDLFMSKKENYLIQIQERIVFPIQVYIVLRIYANDQSIIKSNNFTSIQIIILKVFSSFCTIFTFILIFVKNLKLNLRYQENLQKGLNKVYQGQFFILLSKITITSIFALFFPKQRLVSILIICGINILLNLQFSTKTFYEHPNIQYLSMLSQFYVWIPTICRIMYHNERSLSAIWVFYIIANFLYLLISLAKPRILMFCLEKKYSTKIVTFSKHIKNSKDNIHIQDFEQSLICYLSLTRMLFLEFQHSQLSWSQNFKSQVLRMIKSDIINLFKTFQKKSHREIHNKKNKKQQRSDCHDTQVLLDPHFQNIESIIEASSNRLKEQNIRIEFFDFLTCLIGEFLIKASSCSYRLMLYSCYSLSDTSNKMKLKIFYSYFIGLSKVSNIFARIDCEIYRNFILEKIGRQQCSYSDRFSKASQKIEKQNQPTYLDVANLNFYLSKQQKQEPCISQFEPFFNSIFNDVTEENFLFAQAISTCYNFIENEQKYVTIRTGEHEDKKKIRNYLRSRNEIRLNIETIFLKYSNLLKNSKRFYVQAIFNYIKNFWLEQDPIVAYDQFVKVLQNFTKSHYLQSKYIQSAQTDFTKDSKNVLCVLSGIQYPDSIMISCSNFRRFLQIQGENQFSQVKTRKKFQRLKNFNQGKEEKHKFKLNNFNLPLWRQEHQKAMTKKSIDHPMNHEQKRYFLLSKRLTNIFQVNFKMYFHMLYENDLLIILDMEHEQLKSLQIFDSKKEKLLYSHKKQQFKPKSSIYSLHKSRNALNSVLDDKTKLKINQFNQFLSSESNNKTTQQVQIFGHTYQIQSVVNIEQGNFLDSTNNENKEIKSTIGFDDPFQSNEKIQFDEQKQILQLKFCQVKKKFRFQKSRMWQIFALYIFSLIFSVLILALYQKSEEKMLTEILYDLNDKIMIEDSYARDQFYRTVDIGMFSNIYQRQLNIALLKPSQKTALFENILISVKGSLQRMKSRHRINPYELQKGTKSESFFKYNWISGYNVSFQMNMFIAQIRYLDALKSFSNLTETNSNLNSSFSKRDINLVINLPKTVISNIKLYKNGLYLKSVLQKKEYISNPVKGVFAQFKKQGYETFKNYDEKQIRNFGIFLGLTMFNSLLLIGVVFWLAFKMSQKYYVSLNTSKKFIKSFRENSDRLKSCIEELNRLSQNSIFSIVKPRKLDYQELKQRKMYTFKAINKQTTSNLISTHDGQVFLYGNPQTKNKCSLYRRQQILLDTFSNISAIFKTFYFSKIAYPSIRLIILIGIFSLVFKQALHCNKDLHVYENGLASLTFINMALLNLFTTNLFLTNFKVYQKQLSPNTTSSFLATEFSNTIASVSSIDKIKLVSQLFTNDIENNIIVEKILYRRLCEEFPQQMQCPTYMAPHVSGLYEKYGQVIKNLNVLFHRLMSAKMTTLGTINTTLFQNRYISSYYSLQQLLHISKNMKMMSLAKLKESLPPNFQKQKDVQSNFPIFFCLVLYLIVDAVLTLTQLYNEARVIEEQFLRIGSYSMLEGERTLFKGYHEFANLAQFEHCGAMDP